MCAESLPRLYPACDTIQSNMLEEDRLNVAAGVHTYLTTNATTKVVESHLPHMAAFLLVRKENWYYFGSTGWWDESYVPQGLLCRAKQACYAS